MISKILGLSIASLTLTCATSKSEDRKLTIKVENFLEGSRGASTPDANNQLILKALSYPSALKFYTDQEILRIIRFTCDKQAMIIKVYRGDDQSASIGWNFTAEGKGRDGTTLQGLARFGATLTEHKPDVLTIECGERVY